MIGPWQYSVTHDLPSIPPIIRGKITMQNLEEGDVIYKDDEWYGSTNEYIVLARLEDLVFVSAPNDPLCGGSFYHYKELEKEFRLTKSKDVKEMTVAEISEELGYDVKIVKED